MASLCSSSDDSPSQSHTVPRLSEIHLIRFGADHRTVIEWFASETPGDDSKILDIVRGNKKYSDNRNEACSVCMSAVCCREGTPWLCQNVFVCTTWILEIWCLYFYPSRVALFISFSLRDWCRAKDYKIDTNIFDLNFTKLAIWAVKSTSADSICT